jgi:PAS domain S-box-containing protein
MKNLKISTRLMLLIGTLAILLLAIGLTGLSGISQSNAALKSVYEDRTVPMGQLADLQHQVLLNRLAIANAVLNPTPETLAKSIADVGANLVTIQKTWDAYMATTLTPEEEAAAKKFHEYQTRLVQEGLEPVMAALRAKDIAGAHRLTLEKIRPLAVPVEDGIEALMDIQIKEAKAAYEAAAARYTSIRAWSIFAIVGGILLTALFGWSLIGGISRSLREALDVATAIGQGDWSHTIHLGSKDEVALVLVALLGIQKNLSQGEQALQQSLSSARTSEAKANSALEQLVYQKYILDQHSIVLITDLHGRITYVNDKFCDISGYSCEELLGQDHALLKSGAHPKGYFQAIYETLERGEIWHGEICNRAKEGHLYWIRSTIMRSGNEQGFPTQYIAISNDITKRKGIEKELQNYRAHLEELVQTKTAELQRATAAANAANLAKSEFLANMSHEIRTPMNGVIGMVDILQLTALLPAQQRMVATIANSSQTLLHILNDILDYSKIEAGKLEVEHIATSLKEVAESVQHLMQAVANAKGLTVSLSITPDLPNTIYCDPTRLRQVLLNLLGNAIKFTPGDAAHAGRASLLLEQGTLADGQPAVLLRVRDNGIGMDPEAIAKLFTPFCQADGSTARQFGGTGLGLSISQSLVALMGGQITVRSSPGAGSEFTVALPLHEVNMTAVATGIKQPDRRLKLLVHAPGMEEAAASGQLILVAEDNETNRDVLGEQLRLLGYCADMAEDGRVALEKWRSGRYALLLTDCHMPHMDGFALTKAIREGETPGTHLPIIAITANAMQGEAQRCLQAGMDDYLSKPMRLQELAPVLEKWLPRG